jgi:hypothetical protein
MFMIKRHDGLQSVYILKIEYIVYRVDCLRPD